MNKFLKLFDKTLSVISIVMVALLTAGVIITVFLRYFFSLSYGWVEELLTMLFVSINFLCAAVCIREKQHISISFFTEKYTGIKKTISELFIQVCIIVVSVFLCIYSIRWIGSVGSTVSPSSGIPFGIFYAIVPISSLISIFYCFINILSQFVPIEEAQTGYFNEDVLPQEINR